MLAKWTAAFGITGVGVAVVALAQTGLSVSSLRAADDEQRRLVAEGKADALAPMLHPHLLVNGPSGRVITRDHLLEQVRSGEIAKERFERVPESVQITGNVGVVVGHENVVAAAGSRDFAIRGRRPFERRYTNIFIFEDGRWKLLARQSSVVAP